jgi:hypothetical protein
MRSRLAVLAAVSALFLGATATAEAQLDNRPYGSPGGGFGMSGAARQAILNQQLSGATPGDVVIGPGGGLLNVTKGDSGLAVTTTQGGTVLPQYRGRNHATGLPYLGPDAYGYGYGGTHDTINTWTDEVTALGGKHY